jgi:tRNA(Arg) A34 adenosine deaminase TadA
LSFCSPSLTTHGSVTITLPEWATESPDPTMNGAYAKKYRSDDEMMSLAVSLSDANVEAGTGGPFGAAIFERVRGDDDGDGGGGEYCKLVSVGMNRVVPLRNSTLHGEMVAIQIAQSKLDTFTLSEIDGVKRQFELFTSCEPCAMCLGGTLWSGVSRLVCGATKDDAQSIGFDEGPVTEDSYAHLVKAGVSVSRGVMREEAADVLRRYGCRGVIYNRTSFVGGVGGSADVVDTVAAS